MSLIELYQEQHGDELLREEEQQESGDKEVVTMKSDAWLYSRRDMELTNHTESWVDVRMNFLVCDYELLNHSCPTESNWF